MGLILAEIGRQGNVTVNEQELGEAMRQEAMRYGAQAQQIFDLMKNNPNAQAQMRAPIFEEKVVDLILGKAAAVHRWRPVTKDELLAEDELPDGYGDAKPAAKAKKPAKAKAKAEAAEEAPAKEAAPKKKAAPKAKAEAEAGVKPPNPSWGEKAAASTGRMSEARNAISAKPACSPQSLTRPQPCLPSP